MDVYARNEYVVSHDYLIKAAIRRNMPLLRALRLELDDVYQELALAMMRALANFDPARCDSLDTHVWAKLQYAILDMKRYHMPCGVKGSRDTRVTITSFELCVDDEVVMDHRIQNAFDEVEAADILAILTPSEREVLLKRMAGYNNRSESNCKTLDSIREKIKGYYMYDDCYASCY